MHIVDSPDLPPLWEVFGASRRDDGHWVLPELRLELASPDAALHLGPQHILLETAGFELATQAAGTDQLQAESAHVMFLSRGKVGPFRVEGTIRRGGDGGRPGRRPSSLSMTKGTMTGPSPPAPWCFGRHSPCAHWSLH